MPKPYSARCTDFKYGNDCNRINRYCNSYCDLDIKVNKMDMTIEDYLAFENHLMEQAEEAGFTYDETPDEATD